MGEVLRIKAIVGCAILLSGTCWAGSYSRVAADVSQLAPAQRLVGDLLRSRIESRVPASDAAGTLRVEYGIDPALSGDAASVVVSGGVVRIRSGRLHGLVHGTGKLLRSLRYGAGSFSVEDGAYDFRPAKSFRMCYFARHFLNWYMEASADELKEYVDDLALGGINAFMVEFAMPEVDAAYETPERTRDFERKSHEIYARIKSLDCQYGELGGANQVPDDSPESIRGVPNSDPLRGNLGFNACPEKPGAMDVILANRRRALKRLDGLDVDCLMHWSFDEGGCECDKCYPWGGRGYLKLIEQLHGMNKAAHPEAKALVSTWVFHDDDFEGLYRYLETHDWVDYIICDAHLDFPKYPLTHRIPGKTKIITFPEISMWGRFPWGGYGAIAMPRRFERLFRQAEKVVDGFMLYSEGIFEDLNKTVVTGLYVDPQTTVEAILRTYCAYEFPGASPTDFVELVTLLEDNHRLEDLDRGRAERAKALAVRMDGQIALNQRIGWRWRLVYLRACIDAAIAAADGKLLTDVTRPHYDEIVRLYHAQRQVVARADPSRKHDGWTCPPYLPPVAQADATKQK